jgi:hypothetical protein
LKFNLSTLNPVETRAGRQTSDREKKKPKQDKNKVTPPSASPFASSGPPGNPAQKGVAKKRR